MSCLSGAYVQKCLRVTCNVGWRMGTYGHEERNEAVADNEIADDERVPLVRPLEPLTEASALLLVSSTSRDTDDVLAGFVDTDSSELYREPALRRSMRMSFGPQDLRDYGTWRQV